MKLLVQIGIIFGLYWVGQCVEAILPFPFPASVISLLLLLVLLTLKVIRIEWIREKADFLLGNLAFFFVPMVSGVINYIDILKENMVQFLIVCVVSTVLTFGATAAAVQATGRLMKKRKERNG